MRQVLEGEPNLRIKQAEVVDLILEDSVGAIHESPLRRVRGVLLRDGRRVEAESVVITTGTFLNGLIHCGENTYPAGRSGEPPSVMLGEALRRLGFEVGRLKTGTPPRLDARTIDFSQFQVQAGDPIPTPFSFRTRAITQPQTHCWIAYTNAETHRAIRENLHRSPLYSGQIKSLGPRYCPSIEDKIVKFPDKSQHQIFLEPEGLDTYEIYVNGMSTSMPIDVQAAMVRSVRGLENADMIRPGYAIEYDMVQPTELNPWLETKKIENLFLAGQINGTTGYEEAACQGIMAGINAGLRVQSKDPVVIERTRGYTGILIDDLVSKGVDEPYRMFTSRAEFRLHLRIDNADERLTPLGYRLGTVKEAEYQAFLEKKGRISAATKFLLDTRLDPGSRLGREVYTKLGLVSGKRFSGPSPLTGAQLLKRPEMTIEDLIEWVNENLKAQGLQPLGGGADGAAGLFAHEEAHRVETGFRYEGYLAQQERQIERLRRAEQRCIPDSFDYRKISGLSREVTEKLTKVRPLTLGQAQRIPGVTPAAVSLVNIYIEIFQRRSAEVLPA